MSKNQQAQIKAAKKIFRQHSGILRTNSAIQYGIHPRTLYMMRDEGIIEGLSRGLYRLSDLPPLKIPDLIPVALKIPEGVVCLISALSYYEITTHIPHEVHIALKRGAEIPRLDYPPIKHYWFSEKAFTEGVEKHSIDKVTVKIYSPAKTIADCFKYRNKIGLDVTLEALRECWRSRKATMDELWCYSKVCRVSNVMRPYLESLTE